MNEQAITPRDCALLVALPLTESEFDADLNAGDKKDFVRQVIARSYPGLRSERLWREVYRDWASRISETNGEVAAHGVTVIHPVRLSDLKAALSRFNVVTLLAHFRLPSLEPSDIYEPRRFIEKVVDGQHYVAEDLQRRLVEQDSDLLSISLREESGLRERLAKALRSILAQDAHKQTDQAAVTLNDIPIVRHHRVLLEETFSDEIAPRSALELSDALHNVIAVRDSIPENFAGILDLSVCHSLMLSEVLKRKRHSFLVLSNPRETNLAFRLLRYSFIIRELARNPGSYIEVVHRIHLALQR